MGRILLRSSSPILSVLATSSEKRLFGLFGRVLGGPWSASRGCGIEFPFQGFIGRDYKSPLREP